MIENYKFREKNSDIPGVLKASNTVKAWAHLKLRRLAPLRGNNLYIFVFRSQEDGEVQSYSGRNNTNFSNRHFEFYFKFS